MIRRLLSRLLRVAPPASAISVFLIFYLLCEGPFWYVQWKFGRITFPRRFGPTLLAGGGLLLGAYRAITFHPYFRPGYLRWLKTTPWTVNKPLPLGPLELVPEDGVALGALVLLGMTLPDFTSLYIINLFLFGHVLSLIATFWKTGASAHGYCSLLFLGFVPQLWSRQWAVLAILAGVYFVVHEGLWRALRSFSWQGESFWHELGFANVPQSAAIDPSCGWSFDRFHRDIRLAKGINRVDALLCCMLGSWWIFSACSLIADRHDRVMAIVLFSCSAYVFAPFGRLLRYVPGYWAPISFWGRIWTLRWIIPGYDQVFVGPICSLAGGRLMLYFMIDQSIPIDVGFPVAAGVAVFIALVCPPRLRRWRLIGQHRMGPTLNDSQATSAGVRSWPRAVQ
jgi:hypothetical protein